MMHNGDSYNESPNDQFAQIASPFHLISFHFKQYINSHFIPLHIQFQYQMEPISVSNGIHYDQFNFMLTKIACIIYSNALKTIFTRLFNVYS